MAGKKKREFKNPSKENLSLGAAIKEFRKAIKNSQEELASLSGLDRTYISLIERGQRSPTYSTIFQISVALKISLIELISRAVEIYNQMELED